MNRLARAALAALTLGLALPAADAVAQAYPIKPVRMIVPFPPGGATDIIARLVSDRLTEMWGQTVLVDYKPGAGTIVGTEVVAKAPPDGYTMGMVITAHVLNPSLRKEMPYDTLKDLAGVSLVAVSHIVITATNSLPANNIRELIAYAKANPGKLNYASPGTGTAMHLAGELLNTMGGIQIVHVPYRGGAAAYPDVISGRIELQIDPMQASMQNIDAKQVKALAITSLQRAPNAPSIPTVAETLPGFNVLSLSGLVVPAATPRDIVRKIHADVRKALENSELKTRMGGLGMDPAASDTPEEFDRFIRSEIAKWADVVKSSGMKLD
ncbi:MAG: tripartite tricarboxylate transporter substrate binding protein [Alphaproteobacteria bacterium]|nr:tripartite tricarboxylate transporter substrate binding protein [Alphaproteobacteria bacterium]